MEQKQILQDTKQKDPRLIEAEESALDFEETKHNESEIITNDLKESQSSDYFHGKLNNSSMRMTNSSIKVVGSSDRPARNLVNTVSD